VFAIHGVVLGSLVAANCIDVLKAGAIGELDQLP